MSWFCSVLQFTVGKVFEVLVILFKWHFCVITWGNQWVLLCFLILFYTCIIVCWTDQRHSLFLLHALQVTFPVVAIRKRKQTNVVDTILFRLQLLFQRCMDRICLLTSRYLKERIRPSLPDEEPGLSPFPFEVHFVFFGMQLLGLNIIQIICDW